MRFGRLLLAGLTALAAYSYAQSAPPPDAHSSLRVLQAVVPMLVHAAETVAAAPAVPHDAHTLFSLDALSATAFGGSLCLLASLSAIPFLRGRPQRTLLRC